MFGSHNPPTHCVIEPQHQPRKSAVGAPMPTHQRFAEMRKIAYMATAIATARACLPLLVNDIDWFLSDDL
jgi:hypothetical protein